MRACAFDKQFPSRARPVSLCPVSRISRSSKARFSFVEHGSDLLNSAQQKLTTNSTSRPIAPASKDLKRYEGDITAMIAGSQMISDEELKHTFRDFWAKLQSE